MKKSFNYLAVFLVVIAYSSCTVTTQIEKPDVADNNNVRTLTSFRLNGKVKNRLTDSSIDSNSIVQNTHLLNLQH